MKARQDVYTAVLKTGERFDRDRGGGGGGAGGAAAPPLFCVPAPTFCAKGKIIKF